MSQAVLLINTNTAKPPVSPVGLEYVGEALSAAGIPLEILDLSFRPDWRASIRRALKSEPLLVGLSVRNTDDCSFKSNKSFLPWISEVVTEVKKLTEAPVFLGGVGFSVMPEAVLKAVPADGGIAGEGEEALPAMAKCLADGEDFTGLPNLVYRRNGKIVCNPRVNVDLKRLPLPRRRLFDNQRYERLGGMVGVETKRGCAQKCIFCADPVAKGRKVRIRPPENVVREFQDLVDQGVSWFHLSDSEFNQPIAHAKEVCQAIVGRGLKIKWYCYCSPVPFDQKLAGLMKKAGCAGINFGVDSLCDDQLRRLGKAHRIKDIRKLAQILRREGLHYIFDLLVGGPGETRRTLQTTIDTARELDVPLVGIATGVRVYPGTPLAKAIAGGTIEGGLHPSFATDQPVFYLSPRLGDDAPTLVDHLVAGDPRFLLLSTPAEKQSYNYADDDTLSRLIALGARGAYWDILRQNK